MARVREANAQVQISGAALWPSVEGNAGVARTREPIASKSSNNAIVGSGDSKHRYVNNATATISASYELILWGKNWSAEQSAESSAEASGYDLETIRITTLADVANTYFTILSLQDRITLAHKNLDDAKNWKTQLPYVSKPVWKLRLI